MLRSVMRAGAMRAAVRGAALRPAAFSAPAVAPAAAVQRRMSSTAAADEEERKAIMDEMRNDIKTSPLCLFMKGEPDAPRCGFSAKAVEVLKGYGVAYTAYNVLAHDAVRQGVKDISGWPTIPQLFVAGEFVGGSDLLLEMHQSGDLAALFEQHKIAYTNPRTGIKWGPVQGAGDADSQ